ncbi:tRNA (guanosine(46)-N7)-methyltransferase TrmB [Oceanithermus sp.]
MLIAPAALPFPADPEALYGRTGPWVLEIGFGDGRFLVELARLHPEWNLLGAEVAPASVSRALRRLKREGVAQARLFRGDARFLLRNLVGPRALERVYVNFPDPWPKKKHAERRLLQVPFFRLLSTRLAAGGALLLTTDHPEYYEFATAEARASGLFEVRPGPPPPETLRTKYARKWLDQSRPIFHAAFVKTAEADEAFPPIRRYPVPHALMQGTLPPAEAFRKQVETAPEANVVLLEAWQAGPGLVVLARVEEAELAQEVLLEARPSSKGVYVGLRPSCSPLVTAGVKRAVGLLVRWLEAQGLEAAQRSY